MDEGEREGVGAEVDTLQAALDEERFRHVAGMEHEPTLARSFALHGLAAHRETVSALRAAGDEPLAQRVAALRAERAQAEAEETWRSLEATATARGPDGDAPLAALELALPRERDPERRRLLATAAAEAMARAASAREEAAEVSARARAEVGLAPDWQRVVDADGLLASSDDAWRDLVAFGARTELGARPRAPGDLSRADLLHLVEAPRLDGVFRAGMLAVALKLTLEPLGLDLARVRVDDAVRPAKWPGAHAVGARISFRARGGMGDWQDLLGAAGRAIAAAAQPVGRRDATLGPALAWALASVLLEPRWLAARADVDRRHALDVVRALALRRLFALRASAAALRVATEVARGLSGAAWQTAYRDALTAATGAAWEEVRASRDADAAALAAELAGAGAGEAMREELRERFDEDWWRNPRTRGHLAGLLAAGRLPEGEAPAPPERAARLLVAKLERG